MKKILMVSYYFPPYAGVSTIRVKKYCKYLPMFNWQPWVFTVDPGHYRGKTVDGLQEAADGKIIQVPYLKIPGMIFMVKLLFPLLVAIYTILNKSKIDAVYMTGSPFHPFVLTIFFTRVLKIPAVLDFRDSWSFNYGFSGRAAEKFSDHVREFVYKPLESLSIKYASKVIFATRSLQDEYSEKYNKYAEKFLTIPNGYDPDDFQSITPRKLAENKSIILTGKFNIYTPEVVTGMFEALKVLRHITFIYVGSEYSEIADTAKRLGVENNVITLPFQPYSKTLELISGADFCMMTTGAVNGVGTKIFDYLALNKPAICFVPRGSIISKQFDGIGHLIICESPHTGESIRQGLDQLLSMERMQSKHDIDDYSRKNSSRHLANILDQLVSHQ